jgi:hypothetical protein
MNDTSTQSRQGHNAARKRAPHRGANGAARTRRPPGESHGKSGTRRPLLLGPLRWLRRKLSALARWVGKRLSAPLRPIARLLLLRWAGEHLPLPLRWLARALTPSDEHGFGFWWLVGTLAVAVGLGMVVALLLTPVAGLIALLGVAIWALVRRHRSKRDSRDDGMTRSERHNSAQARDQGFDNRCHPAFVSH